MFAKIKIILFFGLTAVLVLGFVSCTEVPVDTDQIVHRKVTDEYKSNFIAKYGQPAPDQSWDFSGRHNDDENILVQTEPMTRVASSAAVIKENSEYDIYGNVTIQLLEDVDTPNELGYIRAAEPNLEPIAWTEEKNYETIDMWPWYVHGFPDQDEVCADFGGMAMYSLGFFYKQPKDIWEWEEMGDAPEGGWEEGWSSYAFPNIRVNDPDDPNDDEYLSLVESGDYYGCYGPYGGLAYYYAPTAFWYGNKQGIRFTGNFQDVEDLFFAAFCEDGTSHTSETEKCYNCGYEFDGTEKKDWGSGWIVCPDCQTLNESVSYYAFREKWELKYYKEYVTPLGAKFWLFDVNKDGDFLDLICLVEPVYIKRYLIEDLGALDDFDFNDIVVDVHEYWDQETEKRVQKAIVRAMGGTLDFDLTIGNTTWSKSGNNYDAAIPYNADAGVNTYSATLCEFEVSGWDREQNNISVTVKKEDSNDTSNGVFTITFPKAGEVPMIIAVDRTFYFTDPDDTSTKYYWMPERVSIPTDYFTTEQ